MNPENENFPAAMIICRGCGRQNAATRLKCLYCGAELELDEAQSALVKPRLRKIETWEKAFNLIFVSAEKKDFDERSLSEIARMTRLGEETIKRIFETGKPLPIARPESLKEADIVRERLKEQGVETCVLSDEDMATDNFPKRLRSLEFGEDSLALRLFNTEEVREIPRGDLVLIVTGAVFEKRIESIEKRKTKGENKTLDATETASDEMLIDLYAKDDKTGFRIEQKGFDFSCLGADKTMLAAHNIKILVEKLKEFAAHAEIADDYLQIRELLGEIWEVEHRTDSQGIKRHSFGKFDLTNLATSSNKNQFTKYSRLRRNLL